MISLIDTHSHIDMPEFENDIDTVIQNALNAGIEKIVVPCVDKSSLTSVLNLCEKYDCLYCAAGFHPEAVQKIQEEDFNELKKICENKKVVAIGECGLDYYWDKTYVNEQKILFEKQIQLAQELNLPILVHDREAHKDCFDMLKEVKNIPVVMHCFSGSLEFAKECLKQGFYLAFGGVLTFKNAKKAREIVKEISLDRLLFETDAPYMTPEPYRGKRNEPAYVKFVAQKAAELRECSIEEIAQITTENAKRIFKF